MTLFSVPAAEAAVDARARGGHVGDGGAAAAREAPARQAAAQGHVLPPATPDAGQSVLGD